MSEILSISPLTGVDNLVFHASLQVDFATAWAAAEGTGVQDAGVPLGLEYFMELHEGEPVEGARGIIPRCAAAFDTSVANGKNILYAYLSGAFIFGNYITLSGTTFYFPNMPDFNVIIQACPTVPLSLADYNYNLWSGNYGTIQRTGTYYQQSVYQEVYLTSALLAAINKSGYTYLGFRFDREINADWLSEYLTSYSYGDNATLICVCTDLKLNLIVSTNERCYTVRQNDERGKPIFLAECKAFNAVTGELVETQYTDNGIARFVALPDDAPVNIEVRWDKQFRLYQNVYEAEGNEINDMVSNAHIQNTDDYTNGVQVTTEPATPPEGRWYVG
jgi:hypothetical protein